jgi:hypothetical protein
MVHDARLSSVYAMVTQTTTAGTMHRLRCMYAKLQSCCLLLLLRLLLLRLLLLSKRSARNSKIGAN